MTSPDRIWMQFADNDNIRKWQCEPFEGGSKYVSADTVETMRDAIERQVENIERWLASGEAATPEESQSIYEQLKEALWLKC